MATDNRNRDRRANPQPFLPAIGFDVPLWLQDFCDAIKRRLEALYVDPTPPAQVTGVVIAKTSGGNLLTWNRAVNAESYQVFAATSGDITTATLIAETYGNLTTSAFHAEDLLTGTTSRYYWIRARNGAKIAGPFSAMISSEKGNVITVTDAVATTIFEVGVDGDGQSSGGQIVYTIVVDSGANMQMETGIVLFNVLNNGGTAAATISSIASIQTITGGGTLTTTWSTTGSGFGRAIQLLSDSSLNFDSTLRYTLIVHSSEPTQLS